MISRLIQLFKIARKLASSGALDTIDQIYKIPFFLKIFFELLSVGSVKKKDNNSKTRGEKLCDALEGMGTTFIKLGQFLATRPDIIGKELANDLEKLQDRLPPFEMEKAKQILKNEIGQKQYDDIIELSKPIAAASAPNNALLFDFNAADGEMGIAEGQIGTSTDIALNSAGLSSTDEVCYSTARDEAYVNVHHLGIQEIYFGKFF